MMEISTGAISRLTFDPAIDNHPVLSADQSRIVFSSTRGAGVDFDIYTADVSNIDGTAIRLTDDSYPNGPQTHYSDRHPHFSPDGTLIVFDSKNRPFEYQIEIVSECSVPTIIETVIRFYENLNVIRIDAAGNLVSYVELDIRDAWNGDPGIWVDDTATYVGHPSFSPDGSKILFTAAIDGDGTVWEAYTVEIEMVSLSLVSNSLVRITNGSDYPPNPNPIQMSGGAHFTEDGSKILYSSTQTQQGNSQLFWAYADEIDQPVQESRRLTSHLGNDYVPEPLDDGRVVFVSVRGLPGMCDLPPDVEGPSMDMDLFIMNPDGSAQTNLSDNDDADEMLLIADEVSWFCGLKPNLSSCTYQPRVFDMQALWLTRYADTMIPPDLLQRFNISNAPVLYNIYWNNLEEYVITQPHLQDDWVNILEGTEFLMTTFPGFGNESAFQGWMMETAVTRDQLFVLPSLMHEYGIGNPPPPEIPLSGTGTATATVVDNPGNHPVLIPGTLTLTWEIDVFNGTVTITGIPGVGALTGALEADDTFLATGDGTYSGFPTSFTFEGFITPEGISGALFIGVNGGLPGGQAIIYEIVLPGT